MCNLQFGHFKCFLGHSETFGAYSCCEQPHDFTRVLVQTVAEQGELEVPEIRPIPGLSPQPCAIYNSVISSVFWVIPKPLGHIRVANSHMTLPESWFKPLRNRENLKFPKFVRFLDFAPNHVQSTIRSFQVFSLPVALPCCIFVLRTAT